MQHQTRYMLLMPALQGRTQPCHISCRCACVMAQSRSQRTPRACQQVALPAACCSASELASGTAAARARRPWVPRTDSRSSMLPWATGNPRCAPRLAFSALSFQGSQQPARPACAQLQLCCQASHWLLHPMQPGELLPLCASNEGAMQGNWKGAAHQARGRRLASSGHGRSAAGCPVKKARLSKQARAPCAASRRCHHCKGHMAAGLGTACKLGT